MENEPVEADKGMFRNITKSIQDLDFGRTSVWEGGIGLLRMFVKKSSVAISILRAAAKKKDSPTLPTDLSVLRDEASGGLNTTPAEVITTLTHMETVALSPDPTLPPGAPFPLIGRVRPTLPPMPR
jgi:hypothetical protein